ncbi:MAG: hypothetical protein ACNFW9_05475 [Candidatus Kerfeldbacteria bacterium]|jgi:hypothetical protein
MKIQTIILVSFILALFFTTNVSAQETYNSKIVLHGTKMTSDSSRFGITGRMAIPNPGAKIVVTIAGPKFSIKDKWSIEFMIGTFSKENVGEMLFDSRIYYSVLKPLLLSSCIEYFPKSGNWYTYFDANYKIGNLGLVGIESENMHFKGTPDDPSFGPRIAIPFQEGHFILIGAYQFHNSGNVNKVWIRAILNF